MKKDVANVKRFEGLLSSSQVSAAPDDLHYYGQDSCKEFSGAPSVILFPQSTEEVVEIVRLAGREGVPLVPSGGRTGYSGGATATGGEVVVSLSRMNVLKALDPETRVLHCQAGITTAAVQDAASAHGLQYPVDFASKGSSQIGGNIATNAGGIRVIRYGCTRQWVLGVEVVTGQGEKLLLNGPLVKNQCGYDVRQLFIGSEGTLGIVTEAYLSLTQAPRPSHVALVALVDRRSVLPILHRVRAVGFTVNVFEYFEANAIRIVCDHASLRPPYREDHPYFVLLEVEEAHHNSLERFEGCLMSLIGGGVAADAVLSHSASQAKELIAYRERISESLQAKYVVHKNDVAVPVSYLPKAVEDLSILLQNHYGPKTEVVIFGHVGDGNLHLNILKPEGEDSAAFRKRSKEGDLAVGQYLRAHGGTVSAEHGIGLLKKDLIQYSRSSTELALMRKIKEAFDPRGIMNPGKVFPSEIREVA